MADFGTFQYGGTAYPLTASTANSLLRDADPSLYYALDYFAAMITQHVGARLIAESAGFSSPITAAVVQVAPMDPAPYLLQQQFKFPLLSVSRSALPSIRSSRGYRGPSVQATACTA